MLSGLGADLMVVSWLDNAQVRASQVQKDDSWMIACVTRCETCWLCAPMQSAVMKHSCASACLLSIEMSSLQCCIGHPSLAVVRRPLRIRSNVPQHAVDAILKSS